MPEHPTDAHFSFTFVFKQALIVTGEKSGFVFKLFGKRVIEGFADYDLSCFLFIDSEKIRYETEVFF